MSSSSSHQDRRDQNGRSQNGRGQNWPDLAGRIIDSGHVLPIRVYFEDTDFSGLVYHANYLKWIERGRSDYLRLLGIHHSDLFDGGGDKEKAAFVVRKMELDFLKPARIDEVLDVRTRCAEIGAAWLYLDQRVFRGDALLFSAYVQVVLINDKGKPLRLSQHIRAALGS